MKTLHLIRHAKSDWSMTSQLDIQRPLNERGEQNCRLMAPYILEAGCCFDHVFCSPALRARSTIELIDKALETEQIAWQFDNALYTFEASDIMNWCRQLDDSMGAVVIIGHNPALSELSNLLTGQTLIDLPTSSYAQLAINTHSWKSLASGTAQLVTLITPKMYQT